MIEPNRGSQRPLWRARLIRLGHRALAIAALGLAGWQLAASASILPTADASYGVPAGWNAGAEKYGMSLQRNMPIVMDDGVTLYGDVYVPTDPTTGRAAPGPFPVILSEVPYGKDVARLTGALNPNGSLLVGALASADGWASWLVKRGYIDVIVDVRGTGVSGGQHELFGARETQDSKAVIDWVSRLPNSNGRVGMISESYEGIDQLLAAGSAAQNSPLKAIFPIFTGNDAFRELINNDGLYEAESLALIGGQVLVPDLDTALAYLTGFGTPAGLVARLGINTANLFRKDGILQMATNIFTNGDDAYAGDFWSQRAVRNVLAKIVANGIAVYLVGGQRDVFQDGDVLSYSGLQNGSVGRGVGLPMQPNQAISGRYQELWGPFYHLMEAITPQRDLTSNLRNIQIAWFDRWLKGIQNGIDTQPSTLHILDQDFHTLETSHYPLTEARYQTYYLGDSTLSTSKPKALIGSDRMMYSGFENLCSQQITEQAIAGLPDLLLWWFELNDPCAQYVAPTPMLKSYTSEPFAAETVVAGQIGATILMNSTSKDTALLLHVDDLAPDGKAQEITTGSIEGSYRAIDNSNSWSAPNGELVLPYHLLTRASLQAVTPGAVTRYDIKIKTSFWTLQPGHRLRLRIGSGDVPHLIPPPWNVPKLVGLYDIQRNSINASRITVPLAPASAFPH